MSNRAEKRRNLNDAAKKAKELETRLKDAILVLHALDMEREWFLEIEKEAQDFEKENPRLARALRNIKKCRGKIASQYQIMLDRIK